MNTADFWTSIKGIITDDFTLEGLAKLEYYAEQFITGRIIYKRFSPREQHGCAQGGFAHVIASLLAGAEVAAGGNSPTSGISFQREQQCAQAQAIAIERWAKKTGCWFENVIDCDIRLNTPDLRQGGSRKVDNEIMIFTT